MPNRSRNSPITRRRKTPSRNLRRWRSCCATTRSKRQRRPTLRSDYRNRARVFRSRRVRGGRGCLDSEMKTSNIERRTRNAEVQGGLLIPADAAQNLCARNKHGNSCGAAADGSPRREPWETRGGMAEPRKGRKRYCYTNLLSPLRGSISLLSSSHGSRRGLSSFATPWLIRWPGLCCLFASSL